MKKLTNIFSIAMIIAIAATSVAMATPSTQIWIPSTDIQKYKTLHLGVDNYIRTTSSGGGANTYVIGLTGGILPFEKVQAEIGFDYIDAGTNAGADKHPMYFNAKIGTPEGSLCKHSPAISIGTYNIGTQTSGSDMNKQNITYGLLAKTLPIIGRISAGGFHGSSSVLVDENGKSANDGLLISWDRTISEISDKLWVAVDYQSGNSAMGAFSFGASWAVSDNASIILGYDIYNNVATGGNNTFTTQLDINFF